MIRRIIISLASMLCIACNSDIFVEPIPDMVENIYLDGCNGTHELRMQTSRLSYISFDNDFDYYAVTSFYDKNGVHLSDHESLENVSHIIYCSRRFAVRLNISDDNIEITALDNTYDHDIKLWLNLYFEHTVKSIDVNISSGLPLEITSLSPFIDNPIYGVTTESGLRQRFNNNTAQDIKMAVYPYKEARSRLSLVPDENEAWTIGSLGNILVPTYADGNWNDFYADEINATIGEVTIFDSACVDTDEEAYANIPANSTVVVEYAVTYATYTTGYSATVALPNSRLTWMTHGAFTLMQPIGYKLEIIPD